MIFIWIIIIKYIDIIIILERYSEAAAVCPKILRQNGKLWEEWIITFNEADKLSVFIKVFLFFLSN